MNHLPPACNTRSKVKTNIMPQNDPNAKLPTEGDPTFIDLSDRIVAPRSSGGEASGGIVQEPKGMSPAESNSTGAVPKHHTGAQITQSVLLKPPMLSFPRPPPPHNITTNIPYNRPTPKIQNLREEISPLIKQMISEAREVMLGEMRAGMQEMLKSVRSSNGELGATEHRNRPRVQYKKRKHDLSNESSESRHSMHESNVVGERASNNIQEQTQKPGRPIVGQLPTVNTQSHQCEVQGQLPMFHTQSHQRQFLGPSPAFNAHSYQRQLQGPPRASQSSFQESGPPETQNRALVNRSELNIEKWGISYQGHRDAMTIEDFLFRLEYLKEHYRCSWGEILRDFHRLLSGEAREWYWLYIRSNRNLDWPSLQFALQRQFASQQTDFELMREITERKQKPTETIDEYFHAMGILRSRLRNPIPEYEMVRLMKGNLRESLAKLVYPIAVYSIEQLRMECKEVERCFPRKERMPQGGFVPRACHVNEIINQVNEQEPPGDEGQASVEELRYQRVTKHPSNRDASSRKNLTCWNCGAEGHVFTDCMSLQRRIFCFKCGKLDVITPKCPVCNQAGNAKRNATTAGVSRSTQAPQE